MLIAARSSQDWLLLTRDSERARKISFSFLGIRLRRLERDFAGVRLTSASHQRSYLLAINVIASSMQCQALSSSPRSP